MLLKRLVLGAAEVFAGSFLVMLVIGWLSSFVDGLPALGFWHIMLILVLAQFVGGFLARTREEFE